jgi:DNA mismatch repair protein MutL
LERGRYPRGVVYLNLPRELVDINVHPQKSEVRFADARAVNDAAYQVLGAALSQAFSLPPPARNRFSEPRTMAAAPTALAREGELSALPPPPVAPKLPPAVSRPEALLPRPAAPPPPPPASRQRDFFHISDAPPVPKYSVSNEPEPAAAGNQQERWGQLKFVAQIRATYLLCEGGKGLYVLDQHAAAERVTFHRLRAQYVAESVASQSLLFPLTVEVGEAQSELLDARAEDIKRLGFDVRVHSSTTVSVHTVPRLLQRASPERLIFDLVSELSRSGRAFSDAVDSALATAACHGSVRAGDTLSPTEAAQLLRDLDEVDFATYCPHGRPIVTFTPWTELERRVGRR